MRSVLTVPCSLICRMVLCAASIGVLGLGPVQVQSSEPAFQTALESLSTERMLADIRTLSAPSLNGRQTGSEDDLRSATWVADQFRNARISLAIVPLDRLNTLIGPEGGSGLPTGFMSKPHAAVVIAPEPTLRISTMMIWETQKLGMDFLPVLDSPSADVQGQIVFVGYGIVDPAHGIDDYAGVDATNRIVLFLRGKPDHYQRPVSHADKIKFARDHGALAYLTTTGPILHPYEIRRGVTGKPSAFYGQLPPDQTIPGAWISTALAEQILAGSGEAKPDRLRLLQEQLNKNSSTRSLITDQYASLRWKTTIQEGMLTNVLGMIPGAGPETIIIGAHRDHFGRPAGLFFSGADDNASGTAVMLEVARALAKSGMRPHRTILLVSFSGEENDLLGSRLYASRPIVPLNSTKAMINIDHAGIGNGRLTVGVTGLDKSVALEAGRTAEFTDKLDVFGFFPGGDHVPFKEAGVPTITVVSGGVHPHFHQPTDTADTIDPEILKTVARYVLTLTWQLANEP